MKYCSTRGKVRGLSFKEALFSGYTSDGGLIVPEIIPKLDPKIIQEWSKSKLTYPQVVEKVVRLFISTEEIPDGELKNCVENAYKKFAVSEIVGLKECSVGGKHLKIAELFHGQTGSFKDYALSLVGQLMQYFLRRSDENYIILVATSGDTGSAAIKAVEGLKGIDIIVLYPDGKMSPVQTLQMNSSTANNVHVFACEGTSDDADVPIKQSFPMKGLCSINAINWARIMIQIAHYAYLQISDSEGEPLDIFVPTGAAGNLTGGVLASLMGFPIKLYVSTNENDNVQAFLNNGELLLGGKVVETPANAMDIRSPYNLERIIYFLSQSAEITASYMKTCEQTGETVIIDNKIMENIREIVPKAEKIGSQEIFSTIRKVWEENNYMICPHTATGVANLLSNKAEDGRKSVIISTASPQKFMEVIREAGIPSEEWEGNDLLRELQIGSQKEPDRSMKTGANWLQILSNKISTIQNWPKLS